MESAIAVVGLEEVKTCVLCLQNTIVEYIVTHSIMDTFLVVEWRPGVRVSRLQ